MRGQDECIWVDEDAVSGWSEAGVADTGERRVSGRAAGMAGRAQLECDGSASGTGGPCCSASQPEVQDIVSNDEASIEVVGAVDPGGVDDELEFLGEDDLLCHVTRQDASVGVHGSVSHASLAPPAFFAQGESPEHPFFLPEPPTALDRSCATQVPGRQEETSAQQQSLALENPAVTVEQLLEKLICPICYRNFRRKKEMVVYSTMLKQKKCASRKRKIQHLETMRNNINVMLQQLLAEEQANMPPKAPRLATTPVASAFTTHDLPYGEEMWPTEKNNQAKPGAEAQENPPLNGCSQCPPSSPAVSHEENSLSDEYETSQLRVGPCGHVYCARCIGRYITLGKKCPVCNQALKVTKLYPLFL